MKTIIQFDLISDIHLDFWVEYSSNLRKHNQKVDKFIDLILPNEPSEVLVIAGDLGHYNKQNLIFLEKLKWYDFQYGINQLDLDMDKIYDHWKSISNDSVLIEGLPRLVETMYAEELTKLKNVLHRSDVIVTHISPDWSKVPLSDINDISNSFYYFNGRELLSKLNKKVWCSGHVHRREDYIIEGCRLVNASLGYPDENGNIPKKIMKVIHEESYI
ncbi:hypothetical protein [Paenibacillus sp. AN1007]|uniref:Calcineurin-like phosphoesterase domain-containing protein n=1 Tax=Paenibacillus sp. AN1007 TaxID=3151385 RepID=A0AAU8N607_9BACL